jgi:cellulose biosynthesis protein BcsQ
LFIAEEGINLIDRVVVTAGEIEKLRRDANTERLAGALVMAALLDADEAERIAVGNGYRLVGRAATLAPVAQEPLDLAETLVLAPADSSAATPVEPPVATGEPVVPASTPEQPIAPASAAEQPIVPASSPGQPILPASAPEETMVLAPVAEEPAAPAPAREETMVLAPASEETMVVAPAEATPVPTAPPVEVEVGPAPVDIPHLPTVTVPRRFPDTLGSIISVYSPSGGAGTTLLAGTLAAVVARRGLRTLLVDLDMQNGNQAWFFEVTNLKRYSLLGLKPLVDEIAARCGGNPAAVAVEGPKVLTEDLLMNHVFRRDDLHVLCALEDPAAVDDYVDPATHIETLLRVLAANFDVIILDLPNTVDTVTAPALFNSKKVVVVSGPDVPGQVKVARMINLVLAPMMEARAIDLGEGCLLAVNRGRGKTEVQMPIQPTVGLPNEAKWAEEFARRHGSLPRKGGAYVRAVEQLSGRLGLAGEEPRR